jgi:hypothetical protein
MKTRFVLPVIILIVAGVAALSAHAQAEREGPAASAWEYQEVELPARVAATPHLNRMGAQGWELVGVTSACPGGPSTVQCAYWAYFKRPK